MSASPGRLALAALVPAIALTVVGCGGGGGEAGEGSSPPVVSTPGSTGGRTPPSPVPKSDSGNGASPSNPPTKVYNAFAECMRKHGVYVPDAGQSQTGQPEQDAVKAQNALKACAKLLRSATPGAG
ncbi:hypothetical protein [Actinomadura rugatobispora]|uniref:Uncharacterized protein n=1 Tax=Actinomadura rugatobispora TaxID=1994 RepID=A0ABW1AIT5_9ACTN|nr:hypothetical protein GCM10010200_112490 [Actinomadura rugatobispora]